MEDAITVVAIVIGVGLAGMAAIAVLGVIASAFHH